MKILNAPCTFNAKQRLTQCQFHFCFYLDVDIINVGLHTHLKHKQKLLGKKQQIETQSVMFLKSLIV